MAKSDSPSIEELAKRIEALEAERDVLETCYRYSHTIDYGPPEAWAEVFTEDGVFDVHTLEGKPGHKETGRAELAHYLSTKELPPAKYDKHVIFSPMITINGDEAKVESYFAAFKDAEGGPAIGVYGLYHDTLVKQNGTWLIKERLAEVETRPRR